MLPLVDHNQVKMVFASRPQKWGRICGKEVDLLSNVAILVNAITLRPLKAFLFCLLTLPSPPIIDFLRYFSLLIGYYGTVFYPVGYSTVPNSPTMASPSGHPSLHCLCAGAILKNRPVC